MTNVESLITFGLILSLFSTTSSDFVVCIFNGGFFDPMISENVWFANVISNDAYFPQDSVEVVWSQE